MCAMSRESFEDEPRSARKSQISITCMSMYRILTVDPMLLGIEKVSSIGSCRGNALKSKQTAQANALNEVRAEHWLWDAGLVVAQVVDVNDLARMGAFESYLVDEHKEREFTLASLGFERLHHVLARASALKLLPIELLALDDRPLLCVAINDLVGKDLSALA